VDELPSEASVDRQSLVKDGVLSLVAVPLEVDGAAAGVIACMSGRRGRAWPDDVVQRLRTIGEIFTSALARAQAESALRRSEARQRDLAGRLLRAQEEERRRIAREMHDDWTQRLAVLGIDVAKLDQQLGVPDAGRPLLLTIREQLVKLSEDVHALSRQLHPSILDDLGLVDALRSECASFSEREGIAVVYRPEDVPASLPKDAALCVYRVAQEALRNVAKHAAVDKTWVSLAVTGRELELRVQDWGIGFDTSGAPSRPGLGLSSMQERARLVGADLSVTSAPGQGTTVTVRVPLAAGEP
jgi:signal transduction histidine kinase